MSDEGEKACPLCAEEMDLTDQQLKPCKCGYEICVWCWHHIMDMAEKEETEGRCPACRTPYNKEKIVGTGANCERLVSEMSVEKKLKSQKGKSKTSEGRKQLSSVRVIQRNLVYVVGLPLNFADEEQLLQKREYFSQYGNVLKVSISRTAAGAIQQFANSTCSVYITYSKEEEAIRCIQSVHGFVLDGRPLKANFGTTKYCHAWLRNVPCTNPDCLYLHEVGSQEDSFTKDEVVSAYTRVQHSIGSSNNIQRGSGNVLPPPADEYCNNSAASSGKPITKIPTQTHNPAVSVRISPPNSSSGRSAALPPGASWATRSSNNEPSNTPCSNGPLKQKPDTLLTAAASPSQVLPLPTDTGKKHAHSEESTISQDKIKNEIVEPMKRIAVSESSFAAHLRSATLPTSRQPHGPPTSAPSNNTKKIVSSVTSSGPALDQVPVDVRDGITENICSDIFSMSINENQQLRNGYIEHIREPPISQTSAKASNTMEEVLVTDGQSKFGLGMPTQVNPVDLHEIEDDLLSFDNQRIKDPEISSNRDFSHPFHHLSKHSFHSLPYDSGDNMVNFEMDRQAIDRNSNLIVTPSNFPGGHPENVLNRAEVINDSEYSNLYPSKEKKSLVGRYGNDVMSGNVDVGESSIISDILSMDFNQWEESVASPRDLVKLLGENDKNQGSFGAPGSRKIQNSHQSRFSFAREEEPMRQVSDFGQSIDYEQAFKQRSFGHDISSSNSLHQEKFVTRNGYPLFNGTESDIFASSHSHISSNKNSVSRSQISAPPGFSAPNRAPPPGFTSHERTEQIFDALSANHMLDASSLLRNQYQTPSNGSYNNSDVEFIDPAILAVGKGTYSGSINNPGLDIRSNFPPQQNTYEEARFQSFLQRSLPPNQNQRFSDNVDRFTPLGDTYGIPSRVMDHTLANNISPYSQFTLPQPRNGLTSNGQWDSWNEIQNGNNMGMAEMLRNDRLGFNKFYGGYEDSRIRMSSSGNLYNGTYGI